MRLSAIPFVFLFLSIPSITGSSNWLKNRGAPSFQRPTQFQSWMTGAGRAIDDSEGITEASPTYPGSPFGRYGYDPTAAQLNFGKFQTNFYIKMHATRHTEQRNRHP